MAIVSTPTSTGAVGAADWCRSQYIVSGGDKVTAGLQVSFYVGRQVQIAAGDGVVGGIPFSNTATVNMTSDPETSANSRMDRLVARKTWPSLQVEFAILKGAPAAVPVLPALSQSHSGVWEFGLGYWTVPGSSGTTITGGKVVGHYAETSADTDSAAVIGAGITTLVLAVPDTFAVPGAADVEFDVLVSMYADDVSAGTVILQMAGKSKTATWKVSRPGPVLVPARLRAPISAFGGPVPAIAQVSVETFASAVTVVRVSADLVEIMP